MDLSNLVIKFLSKYFDLNVLLKRWNAIKNLGKSENLDIPPELLRLNLDILSRSFYNINAIQPHLDWIFPYWIEKQYDPEDVSFLPSSYLSINLTQRNWTGVSSVNSDFEAIVDPRGLLTPLFDGWSVDFWVKKGNYIIIPAKLDKMNQHLIDKTPVVKSTFFKKSLQITSEVLMHNNLDENYVIENYTVENLDSKKADIIFYICIRPYNPESIIPIFSIDYIKKKNTFNINNNDWLYLEKNPDRIICSNQNNGDAYFYIPKKKTGNIIHAKDKGGLTTAFAEYKIQLKPGEYFSTNAIVPVNNNNISKIRKIFKTKYYDIKNRFILQWQRKKEGSFTIKTPDTHINDAFESYKNNLLVLLDKTEIPPGPFTYHNMWFRDAAYSITVLLKLGFHDDVKRILKNYFKRQQKDGYFLSQQNEWDANGQVLWTICQYAKFTNDLNFIQDNYKALYKAVQWIFNQRKKSMKKKNELHYGLLPSGFSAEHFGPANYYYWDNFWAYAGVRDFIETAEKLNKNMSKLKIENKKYLKDIEKSIKKFQLSQDQSYIPSSPYRKQDCSIIGSVSALYPLQVIDPLREDVTNTLKIIRKKYMQEGAFFHKLLHSGYNIYLTAQVAECFIMRKSTMIFPILEWILKHATDTYTFPEAIHPETFGGCMGDGHHGWAISEMIHLLRNMIFYEKGDELIFFPVIPHHWLDMGNILEVNNARCHFGQFDLTLTTHTRHIEFSFKSDFYQKPKKIEINLPIQIDAVEIEGKKKIIDNKSFSIIYNKDILIKIFIK